MANEEYKNFSVYLKKNMIKEIKKACIDYEVDRSEFVEKVFKDFFEREKNKKDDITIECVD